MSEATFAATTSAATPRPATSPAGGEAAVRLGLESRAGSET
ncbi:hypothetical protein [Actinomadura chokoriensis]|uniref:Uncharacterized protein n=1 Tax=Actinomadura chokoriensis TaxID=454156 RepID=A0ABV4R9X7_9ACTN